MAVVTKTIGTSAGTAGTGTITAAGTAVTGTGTSFLSEIVLPEYIVVSGVAYQVASVTDDTNLTLETSLTATDASFNIGARDYSTITLWEADLDDGVIYSATDDADGEIYNDSVFDETVTINGGSTIGLSSVNLTVPNAERHDGTAGTGARIERSGTGATDVVTISSPGSGTTSSIEYLEVTCTGTAGSQYFGGIALGTSAGTPRTTIQGCLIHDIDDTVNGSSVSGIDAGVETSKIQNCIVYSIKNQGTSNADGITVGSGAVVRDISNCTVWGIEATGSDNARGIVASGTSMDARNCIAGGLTVDTGTATDFIVSGVEEYNIASDTSVSGTGSTASADVGALFVSTTGGSEDFHLVEGAIAIGTGSDLGTTDNQHIDANGGNRDSFAQTWDIGAFQYEIKASIGTTGRDYSTITLWEADLDDTTIYGNGSRAKGEMYADTDFSVSGTLGIDGGGTVGLSRLILSVASTDRHDGTANTGVRLLASAAGTIIVSTNLGDELQIVEWPEVDSNGFGYGFQAATNTNNKVLWRNILAHGRRQSGGSGYWFNANSRQHKAQNTIVYDGKHTTGSGAFTAIYGINGSRPLTAFNCTVHNITHDGTGGVANFGGTVLDCRNCIATDVGGTTTGTKECFGGSYTTEDYNASSDATAGGVNSLTSITTANQYVSTTGGSEDLHIKEGADVIAEGTDLGATNGVNIDINGGNRDAFSATTWDIGAHQFQQVASIGTTSRDYSTVTLWEADLDDTTIYGGGSRAKGEAYADTNFDESFTINGGGTVGLDWITLTAASGERHDGTAGSGARNVRTAVTATNNQARLESSVNTTLSDLEWDANGERGIIIDTALAGASTQENYVERNICHGFRNISADFTYQIFRQSGYNDYIQNNFIFDCSSTRDNFGLIAISHSGSNAREGRIRNNTICNIDVTNNGTGDATGITIIDDADFAFENNLVLNVTATSGNQDCYSLSSVTNATMQYNASSDTTAGGTGSLTSLTASTEVVSTTVGAEDLHLKEGASCIAAGLDKTISPTGINLDINVANRDAFAATTWDIGAHQFALTASIGTTGRDYATVTLWESFLDDTSIYGSGSQARGELYADTDFDEAVTWTGGETVGLSVMELVAASGEQHDGTAGTGVRWLLSTDRLVFDVGTSTTRPESILAHVEVDKNGTSSRTIAGDAAGGIAKKWYRILSHGGVTIAHNQVGFNTVMQVVANCIVYDETQNHIGTRPAIAFGQTSSARQTWSYNCVAWNITNDNGTGGAIGFIADDISHEMRNCYAGNVGGTTSGTIACFNVPSGTPTNQYNFSSDGTASGTGSATSKAGADIFVSVTGGSEDFHLKTGSDAIDAGEDLGNTPTGISIDINGGNRDAFTATTWDIGAHQFALTASIGATGRDYATVTLWEFDLDDTTIYGGGSRAKGEAYNDTVFDESVTINGGGTVGLNFITLSVASTDRHDGTAGTGVRNVRSAYTDCFAIDPTVSSKIEWWECDNNQDTTGGAEQAGIDCGGSSALLATETLTVANCVIHGQRGNFEHYGVVLRSLGIPGTVIYVQNNIIYDIYKSSGSGADNAAGIASELTQPTVKCWNNTIHDCSGFGTGTGNGILFTGGVAASEITNNIVTDTTHGGGGTNSDFNTTGLAVESYNISEDATATGTGSITSVTVANQYVSTIGGSEDLHLKTGSDAIDAGTDLGTTGNVNIDINGRDRDTGGDVWDIGAHEFILANSYNQLLGLGPQHIEDTSIEGWWPCQDNAASTVVLDRSSNSRNMTASANTSTLNTAGPGGYLANALNFTSSAYATVGSLSISSFPLTLAMKMLSPSTTGNRYAFCASDAADVDRQAYIGCEGGLHQYCVRTRSDGAFDQARAITQTNSWRGVSGTDEGTRRELFVDGASQATNTTTFTPFTISAYDLGRLGDLSPSYSDQAIADAVAFSRVLSGTEIDQHYKGPEPTYVSGAVLATGGYFDVGTWDLEAPFNGTTNGAITYEVVAATADGTVVDTATTATGSLNLSSARNETVYLLVRASNTGGYDIGDSDTRTSNYGTAEDGYYELTSVLNVASSYNELFGLGSQHTEDASLEGWWLLQDDAANTTVADQSSNARTATLAGGDNTSTLSTTGPNSYLTKAIDFDGANDYVNTGGATYLDGVSGMTALLRVNLDVVVDDAAFWSDWGNDLGHVLCRQGPGGVVELFVYDPTQTGGTLTPSTALSAAAGWQTVSARFTGSNIIAGVDGTYAQSASTGSTLNSSSSNDLYIFDTPHNNDQSNGQACDAVMLSRALTDDEIAQWEVGPEPTYTSGASFTGAGVFNVGTWGLEAPFASGSNGNIDYEVIAVNAAGSVIDSALTASGTLDISSETGNTVYLLVRASNTGGYDVGDKATRTSAYGSANDGYYELASVTAGSTTTIPIFLHHYNSLRR